MGWIYQKRWLHSRALDLEGALSLCVQFSTLLWLCGLVHADALISSSVRSSSRSPWLCECCGGQCGGPPLPRRTLRSRVWKLRHSLVPDASKAVAEAFRVLQARLRRSALCPDAGCSLEACVVQCLGKTRVQPEIHNPKYDMQNKLCKALSFFLLIPPLQPWHGRTSVSKRSHLPRGPASTLMTGRSLFQWFKLLASSAFSPGIRCSAGCSFFALLLCPSHALTPFLSAAGSI